MFIPADIVERVKKQSDRHATVKPQPLYTFKNLGDAWYEGWAVMLGERVITKGWATEQAARDSVTK